MAENMQAAAEIWRGAWASTRWLVGAPIVTGRIALTATDKNHARELMANHFTHFLRTCRITVDLEGIAPERGRGCVICHNESSFADIAAYGMVMWPHVDRAAAASLYSYLPFGRSAARIAGIEMVPRGNRWAIDRLLEKMVAAVRAGERVAWGGEGRLYGRDGVGRFKIGASLIAIRAQSPLIPVAFCGGHQILPLGSIRARPGRIRVRFGDAIPTAGLHENNARELADRTQAIVADMYQSLKRPSNSRHSGAGNPRHLGRA